MPSNAATEVWRVELDTINVAAQRIARIVQEFVKLSQVEGGHYELVDLTDLLRSSIEKFQAREDSQDIAISETLPQEPLWVRASPQLLEQVVTHLLTNALEAMPRGGGIQVHAGTADKNRIYCSVEDSGHGVATQDLKRVFEPGYTTKVEGGVVRGIGLGLYTAERIIVSHGGAIWLESELGKYTIVTFTLPRARTGGD
jgi:two-component system sensor histidine kinase VicK